MAHYKLFLMMMMMMGPWEYSTAANYANCNPRINGLERG